MIKINKRQAKLILKLPDGYEWQFLQDEKYIVGHADNMIMVYEVIGDEVIQKEIKE